MRFRLHALKFLVKCCNIFFYLAQQPQCASASSFTSFLDHTQQRITVDRTPLDEWSARRTDH